MEPAQKALAYDVFRTLRKHRTDEAKFLNAATVVTTKLMSPTNLAWRVCGITEAALERFAAMNFKRKSGLKVQRAHLFNRADTTKQLVYMDTEPSAEEFIEFWEKRDRTVLCLSDQNRKILALKCFKFEEREAPQFPNLTVGYGYKDKEEGEFLRMLYASRKSTETVDVSALAGDD